MRPIRCFLGENMYCFILMFLIVIADQVSKHYAVLFLQGKSSFTVIIDVFSFQYHENRGAAWGMLENHRWIFMTVSIVAIIAIIAYIIWTRKERQSRLLLVSLSMFAGGGIGNMIDRIFLGYVVDFLRFDFIDFPIFNVADSFITIGAGLMILYLILESIHDWKSKHNKGSKNESN